VAYLSAAEGLAQKTAVYVMDVASGASSKWIEINGKASWLAIHRTKTMVAFVSQNPAGAQEIVLRDLRAGSERVIATGGQFEALRWHPNGSMLAWSGPIEGGNVASNGIWILEPSHLTPRQVIKDGYSPGVEQHRRCDLFRASAWGQQERRALAVRSLARRSHQHPKQQRPDVL
jgi:hypothetical protein